MPPSPWSPEEDAFLREHATRVNATDIAQFLGRSRSAVTQRALKLSTSCRVPTWTAEADEYLKTMATKTSHADIAQHLGVSTGSVKVRASKLKIPGRPRGWHSLTPEQRERGFAVRRENPPVHPRAYTADESQFIADNYLIMEHAAMAAAIGRTKSSVSNFCHIRGYKRGHQSGDKHAAWRGGKKHHNQHWMTVIRPAVLERDNYTCQHPGCGLYDPSGSNLRAHHIVPWKLTQDDSMENHVTLCQPHHSTQRAHRWRDVTPELLDTLPLYQQAILGRSQLTGVSS